MSIVTRFAPSPTGFLHIGGARTALFNWLYARHHGGVFRLRIEDTDRARSTQEAIDAILDGLKWLELGWDDEVVYQSRRLDRHAEVANALLASGHAYRCWSSPEEIAAARDAARAAGKPLRFASPWRDRDPAEAPPDTPPVIRFRAPREGETVIADAVQGEVRVANAELDDMVMLRADGTPTYMLSVVVDDHDMEVTHAIRGDDHLTNAFRQTQLFLAMGWTPPAYAHIPLIHGADGAKLSKRHGALGVGEYRAMGFLPEAMRNYLLRLGWSHGDDEIIPTDKAIEWFDLGQVGRSAARFDMDKLTSVNAHWLREADDARLVELIAPMLSARADCVVDEAGRARLVAGMAGLKSARAHAGRSGGQRRVLRQGAPDRARRQGREAPHAGGAGPARPPRRCAGARRRLAARRPGGCGPPLRRGGRGEAGRGRPAAARGAHRCHNFARNFRRHGRAGTGGDARPHARFRRILRAGRAARTV